MYEIKTKDESRLFHKENKETVNNLNTKTYN